MRVETQTKENGKVHTDFKRENWKEYFKIFVHTDYLIARCLYRQSDEYEAIPWFMLPVYKDDMRDGWICWVWPLAPFVLIGVASYRALLSFWKDLIKVINLWRS